MFCQKCGAPSDTSVCPKCASKAQMQAQPSAASDGFLSIVKKNFHFVLAGLGIVLFIFGVLNLFSVFEVNISATNGNNTYAPVSDAAQLIEFANASPVPIYIGNILFGFTCLCAAAVGVLYFLKLYKNINLYDNRFFKFLIMGKKERTPATAMGGLVISGTLIQFVLYMLCALGNGRTKITFGINWTSWLLLAVFVLVAILDKFALSKKEK